jgi:hypothetical protein
MDLPTPKVLSCSNERVMLGAFEIELVDIKRGWNSSIEGPIFSSAAS